MLVRFDFRITHVKEIENGRADALSRRPDYAVRIESILMSLLKEKDKYLIYHNPEISTLAVINISLSDNQKLEII